MAFSRPQLTTKLHVLGILCLIPKSSHATSSIISSSTFLLDTPRSLCELPSPSEALPWAQGAGAGLILTLPHLSGFYLSTCLLSGAFPTARLSFLPCVWTEPTSCIAHFAFLCTWVSVCSQFESVYFLFPQRHVTQAHSLFPTPCNLDPARLLFAIYVACLIL